MTQDVYFLIWFLLVFIYPPSIEVQLLWPLRPPPQSQEFLGLKLGYKLNTRKPQAGIGAYQPVSKSRGGWWPQELQIPHYIYEL